MTQLSQTTYREIVTTQVLIDGLKFIENDIEKLAKSRKEKFLVLYKGIGDGFYFPPYHHGDEHQAYVTEPKCYRMDNDGTIIYPLYIIHNHPSHNFPYHSGPDYRFVYNTHLGIESNLPGIHPISIVVGRGRQPPFALQLVQVASTDTPLDWANDRRLSDEDVLIRAFDSFRIGNIYYYNGELTTEECETPNCLKWSISDFLKELEFEVGKHDDQNLERINSINDIRTGINLPSL